MGQSACAINGCENSGFVSVEEFLSTTSDFLNSEFYVAGISGYVTGAVKDSHNHGTAKARGPYAWCGGIAGYNDSVLSQCSNTGTVIGTSTYAGGAYAKVYSGGIAGYSTGMVSESYNTGFVDIDEALASEATFSGGIVLGLVFDLFRILRK